MKLLDYPGTRVRKQKRRKAERGLSVKETCAGWHSIFLAISSLVFFPPTPLWLPKYYILNKSAKAINFISGGAVERAARQMKAKTQKKR